ncbi:MAG: DPP IV N-terminal domain-containing protein [Candidatus Solibacter sp.]
MHLRPSTTRLIRFGTFELNLELRQLKKRNRLVKVQELPYRLLITLLERHGEIVTREELRTRLWGDTVVEYDEGLHTAICKLREVLGDSAARPRFIATIPRRGYSFIASVTVDEAAEEAPDFNPEDTKQDEPALPPRDIVPTPPVAPSTSAPPAPIPQTRRLPWIAGIGLLGLFAALAYLGLRNSTKRSSSPEVVPLTSYRGLQRSPTLSPDGLKVAFIWVGESGDNLDIYEQRLDGSGRVRLTKDPAAEEYPAWSPDGRLIAFIRSGEIFIVPSQGGVEHRLTTARGRGLGWSPDSRLLAFSDEEFPGDGRAIFSFSIETGERRMVAAVTQNGDDYMWPSFTPDGKQVAYLRRATTMTDVWRAPSSGGKPIRMAITDQPASGLVWTPDGKYLLYATGRHAPGLLAIPAEARDATRLQLVEIAGTNVFEPTIAPGNGRSEPNLAFGHENTNWDIWGAPLESGGIGRASPIADSIRADQAPSISPDGKQITFSSARSGYEEIWVAMSDGSQPRQLTTFKAAVANSPRWSPDGKLVVFDATVDHNSDIYAVDPQGGALVRVTHEPSAEVQANWSHDGKWIYFMSDRSGRKQLWKLPSRGGPAVQVTLNGGFQAFESADGNYVYYAKQQYGRGVWRVPANGGAETLVSGEAWHNLWCLTGNGLYYFDVSAVMPDAFSIERPLQLRRLDLVTNVLATVGTISVSFPMGVPALDVSRDGKYVTWVAWREHSSELMLIRNFRLTGRP